VIVGIEKTMNNKDLILNATSQNDVIKVRTGRFETRIFPFQHFFVAPFAIVVFPLQLAQFKHSRLNLSRQKIKSHPIIILKFFQNPRWISMVNFVHELSLVLVVGTTLEEVE
jgi:hypothetical protein